MLYVTADIISFTVLAIPEPETYALLLAGLAAFHYTPVSGTLSIALSGWFIWSSQSINVQIGATEGGS